MPVLAAGDGTVTGGAWLGEGALNRLDSGSCLCVCVGGGAGWAGPLVVTDSQDAMGFYWFLALAYVLPF